jgi:hypothetical protein
MAATMEEILDDLVQYLVPDFGGDMVASSAVLAGGREAILRQMDRLAGLKPLTIVEIGTRHGVMAALLSRFTECVISFDVRQSPCVDEVMAHAHVNNVAPLHVSDRKRDMVLERLDFDLAFIDIGRDYGRLAPAFTRVRRCGTVLFHGYGEHPQFGVTQFVDSLKQGVVERDPPFAWWRETKNGLQH